MLSVLLALNELDASCQHLCACKDIALLAKAKLNKILEERMLSSGG